MQIELLPQTFSVAKIDDLSLANLEADFVFLAKTDEEISLVCESSQIPLHCIAAEEDWRGLKIAATMDFALIGVIARLTSVLAAEDIPVFVISTFNTDYIFVKNEDLSKALYVLEDEYQSAILNSEA